jgi:hypothetical protein
MPFRPTTCRIRRAPMRARGGGALLIARFAALSPSASRAQQTLTTDVEVDPERAVFSYSDVEHFIGAEGRLAPERLASYRKLQAEAAHERRRTDPRARAEHVSEWKTAMKTLKYHPKHQRRD